MDSELTFGSLFSGIGGLDLGFERAGMRCKWQVENEPFCIRILEVHWPHVARFGDVRQFAPDRNEHSVDVLCGGTPCQDLSVAGRRAGLNGERSGLFWELVRVASALRPAWLALENVPGLLSSQGGRDMGTLIGALADLGYCVCWRVLDSQYFGVAQRRRRVFIIGHPDPNCAAAVLFEPEGSGRNPAAVQKPGTNVAYCLDAGAGGVSGKEQQRTLVPYIQSRSGKGGFTDPVNDGIIAVSADQSIQQQRPDDGSLDAGLQGLPRDRDYCVIGSQVDSARMRTAPGIPGPLDLCEVCAEGPDGPRYRALGNAVTVNVAEWIGRRIVACAART